MTGQMDGVSETTKKMREIALDIPEDMTNREYWLRTEIYQWAEDIDSVMESTEHD